MPLRQREEIQKMLPPEEEEDAVSRATVLARIRSMMDGAGVPYREIHHSPTRTSREAAEARGESIRIGGKAIVAKVDKRFHLFVLSAALELDSRAICRHLKAQRFRFAHRARLADRREKDRGNGVDSRREPDVRSMSS